MKTARPSEGELKVLSVLWQRGPSTVREVLENLPDGKARAYTTVLTILQVMEKKGLVAHTREGLTHTYHTKVTRRQVTVGLWQHMVRHLFGGNPAAAMQNFLAETEISERDSREIRKVLDEHARREKSPGRKGEGK